MESLERKWRKIHLRGFAWNWFWTGFFSRDELEVQTNRLIPTLCKLTSDPNAEVILNWALAFAFTSFPIPNPSSSSRFWLPSTKMQNFYAASLSSGTSSDLLKNSSFTLDVFLTLEYAFDHSSFVCFLPLAQARSITRHCFAFETQQPSILVLDCSSELRIVCLKICTLSCSFTVKHRSPLSAWESPRLGMPTCAICLLVPQFLPWPLIHFLSHESSKSRFATPRDPYVLFYTILRFF